MRMTATMPTASQEMVLRDGEAEKAFCIIRNCAKNGCSSSASTAGRMSAVFWFDMGKLSGTVFTQAAYSASMRLASDDGAKLSFWRILTGRARPVVYTHH